ncbi:MAG: hypothetical protein ACODAA_05900, partial [Gemmatimonadota bacterium]
SVAAFARVLVGMYHRRIDYPSGVRAHEEREEARPEGTERPAPASPAISSPRKRASPGSEDQLEAALEAAEVTDPEASLRAADE